MSYQNAELEGVELARAAAAAFCATFGFTEEQCKAVAGPPLFGPTEIERKGRAVAAYRWLGGGRGDAYVQPEIDSVDGTVVVFGGFAHQEFGPWIWTPDQPGSKATSSDSSPRA